MALITGKIYMLNDRKIKIKGYYSKLYCDRVFCYYAKDGNKTINIFPLILDDQEQKELGLHDWLSDDYAEHSADIDDRTFEDCYLGAKICSYLKHLKLINREKCSLMNNLLMKVCGYKIDSNRILYLQNLNRYKPYSLANILKIENCLNDIKKGQLKAQTQNISNHNILINKNEFVF